MRIKHFTNLDKFLDKLKVFRVKQSTVKVWSCMQSNQLAKQYIQEHRSDYATDKAILEPQYTYTRDFFWILHHLWYFWGICDVPDKSGHNQLRSKNIVTELEQTKKWIAQVLVNHHGLVIGCQVKVHQWVKWICHSHWKMMKVGTGTFTWKYLSMVLSRKFQGGSLLWRPYHVDMSIARRTLCRLCISPDFLSSSLNMFFECCLSFMYLITHLFESHHVDKYVATINLAGLDQAKEGQYCPRHMTVKMAATLAVLHNGQNK